jgi:hypothetical protein
MVNIVDKLCFALLLALFGLPPAFAQDSEPAQDEDGSSEQVEQRDDAFRRQMELEDARSRDRTYVDSTYGGQKAKLEKIDKLPEESRDNIRDQLVDVIMENGDWEPKDVLEEYPYTPTEGAQSDPELKQQEQEAWDEQVDKYHEREAAAFGAHRGPVPGPGNPTGQEGGEQGEGSEQGEQGGNKAVTRTVRMEVAMANARMTPKEPMNPTSPVQAARKMKSVRPVSRKARWIS